MTQVTTKKCNTNSATLYMAIELSKNNWKLAFGIGGKKHRIVNVKARDFDKLWKEINTAKTKFSLPNTVEVKSCYEAGRDGFWIHRMLIESGIHNVVIDPASLDVKRHGRQKKTDRIDSKKMLISLIRYWVLEEDSDVFSIVKVPSIEEEDNRRLHRELERLKNEKKAHQNRIQGLLFLHGLVLKPNKNFLERIEQIVLPNKQPLPEGIKAEVIREYERLQLTLKQIKELENQQVQRMTSPKTEAEKIANELFQLKGIGIQGAWILSYELFCWRELKNRKQVGALVGLTPTPFDSGESKREQGISKSGSRRIRSLMVQLSWIWIRYQPLSKISLWYQEHFGKHSKRSRRVGIVAVARRLLISLWRYSVLGEVIDGAV